MRAVRLPPFLRAMLCVLPLSLGLLGCETLEKINPFAEKQTPLPGERVPLFPGGVPGVDFGAPPPQPANSNIPITGIEPQQAEERPQPQAARMPPRSGGGESKDAWAGTR